MYYNRQEQTQVVEEIACTIFALRGYLQPSAGGIAIAADREQQLALVLIYVAMVRST